MINMETNTYSNWIDSTVPCQDSKLIRIVEWHGLEEHSLQVMVKPKNTYNRIIFILEKIVQTINLIFFKLQ